MDCNIRADSTAQATVFNPGLEDVTDSVIRISFTGPAKYGSHDVENIGTIRSMSGYIRICSDLEKSMDQLHSFYLFAKNYGPLDLKSRLHLLNGIDHSLFPPTRHCDSYLPH